MSGIGFLSEPTRTAATRVLSLLSSRRVIWRGDAAFSGEGMTTGNIAAALDVRPRSADRGIIEEALTTLRKHRLVHYKFDRSVDAEIRWWATPQGLSAVGAFDSESVPA